MVLKKALTIQEQVESLRNRGMLIDDPKEAELFLNHVSYYRLSEYWLPMQIEFIDDKFLLTSTFKKNSKFKDVVLLYNFDRDLRFLIFDAIEKIEISFRSKLIYHLSHEYGPWWFQDFSLFEDRNEISKTLVSLKKEVDRSKEKFIIDHKNNNKDDLRLPPSWKTLELTTLGSLSKLYGNLKNKIAIKDKIASEYGTVNHTYLRTWLQSITQIRNCCAHHSRLWNKILPFSPKIMATPPNNWVGERFKPQDLQYLYAHLCCIKYLLNVVHKENSLTT